MKYIGMQFWGRNQSIEWDEIELLLQNVLKDDIFQSQIFFVPDYLESCLDIIFVLNRTIFPLNSTSQNDIHKKNPIFSISFESNQSLIKLFFFSIFNAQVRKRNEQRIINVLNRLLRLILKGTE